jgi:hypothetical protein
MAASSKDRKASSTVADLRLPEQRAAVRDEAGGGVVEVGRGSQPQGRVAVRSSCGSLGIFSDTGGEA